MINLFFNKIYCALIISAMINTNLFSSEKETHCIDLRDCINSNDDYVCRDGWVVPNGEASDISAGFSYCWDHISDHGNSEPHGSNYVMCHGTLCSKSQLSEATTLWESWTKSDKFSQGTRATLAGVILILHLFDNGQGIYKGMDKFKISCALEYIYGICAHENEMHYCFKDYIPGNEPRLHFGSEQQRQEIINLIKKEHERGAI